MDFTPNGKIYIIYPYPMDQYIENLHIPLFQDISKNIYKHNIGSKENFDCPNELQVAQKIKTFKLVNVFFLIY